MNTITVNVYTFTELPEEVQQKLIDKRMEAESDDDWWIDDAIYFDLHAGHFSLEGRYSYKPGAVKQLKYERPTDTDLHSAAQSLLNAQKKHFYKLFATLSHPRNYTSRINIEHYDRSWDDDFPEMKEAIEEVYNWALGWLEKEYDWHTGEENARQLLEDDDTLYLINGKKAPTSVIARSL